MTLGRDIRKVLFGFGLAVVIAAWASVAVVFAIDAPKALVIAMTVAAALASEGVFWLGVVLLGWSVLDRRRALWRWIAGRGQGRKEYEA
ncbi:hypothetical protein E5163_09835 [Marinicauda algicola]|uniref:Transporter suffix domain-containing protein n=1 Tax=Marinicauda algicola TaxID=2029849 RepID=A0A4S2GZ82_9PROT|nr:hypothetical protein [Marinicauda algicola]TGY88132.1 hypothetical protein E5163_09835 [Marinicauda algicola]